MVFGTGPTGFGFIEGQFNVILGELGILGAVSFYWVLIRILRYSYRVYKISTDTLTQSLMLSLFGCLVGLLFQSFANNTFVIVRIMEPFWFLTGLVMRMEQWNRPPGERSVQTYA